MQRNEVMQRVVGILTEAVEMRRQAREHPDSDVVSSGAVAALLAETLPDIRLPAEAGGRAAVDIITEELGPAIVTIANCFAFAFVQLAEIHDAGRTDVPAAEVLRAISLRLAGQEGQEGQEGRAGQ
ncbi:hypothetical protein ACFWNK_25705 [Streptomyces sp. NPDC058417]|uniref:hypothetical protein n=1 Tax=unclassified Streptomyces TaxID=2593676 RepID=UPI003660614A